MLDLRLPQACRRAMVLARLSWPIPLSAPSTIAAEACYLIDRYLGPAAGGAFLDSVGIGDKYTFQLAGLTDADLRRMADLVRRYADRRLGGTDASVIATCERLAIITVATVNLRDFANVRLHHITALTTGAYYPMTHRRSTGPDPERKQTDGSRAQQR